MSTTDSSVFTFPHPVWRVGFSGHRKLEDESLLSEALYAALQEAKSKVDGQIECLLSLAQGADILMVEACSQLKVPYHILLPSDEAEFREEIARDWMPRFNTALEGAISVESLSGSRSKGAAYYKCGIEILNASDIMLFCWDGEAARGMGGTGQIAEAAIKKRVPYGRVDAESGAITWEHLDSPLRDATSKEVEKFASLSVDLESQTKRPEAIEQVLKFVDCKANEAAPRHRFLAVTNLSIHSIATIIATIGLGFTFAGFGISKVILLLIALGVFFFAQRQQLHERWYLLRGLGEMIRSLQTCGPFLPRSAMNQIWENFYQFGLIVRPLYNFVHQKSGREANWERNRATYLTERIDDQIAYYTKRVASLSPVQKWLNRLFWIFLGSAIIAACVYAVQHSIGHDNVHQSTNTEIINTGSHTDTKDDSTKSDWLGKSTIILPILSMLIISIKSSLDIDRRLSRYSEMNSALKRIRKEVEILAIPSSFYEAVVRIERQLLQETSEWYQNVKHLHIH